MVNGNSVNFQFAKETTFATGVAPDTKLNISTESFNDVYGKTEEGLLTGGIGGNFQETMEVSCEGDFSTLGKPTSSGYIFKGVLGVEAVTAGSADDTYDHVFTPVGNGENDYLPSWSVTIDRKASCKRYTGVTFNSLSLSAAAKDRVQYTVSCLGYDAETGTVVSSLSDSGDDEKSFKFYQGKIYIDSVAVADITNIDFSYNNNADNSVQTTDTGIHHKQPQPGQRECTCGLTALYTSALETVRNNKFKLDATLSFYVEFIDDDGNKLKIELPKAQITDMPQANATGKDTMTQELKVSALDNSTAFVKVTLTNTQEDSY